MWENSKIPFLYFVMLVGIDNCLMSIKIISRLAFGTAGMVLMPELGYLVGANPAVQHSTPVPSVQRVVQADTCPVG